MGDVINSNIIPVRAFIAQSSLLVDRNNRLCSKIADLTAYHRVCLKANQFDVANRVNARLIMLQQIRDGR